MDTESKKKHKKKRKHDNDEEQYTDKDLDSYVASNMQEKTVEDNLQSPHHKKKKKKKRSEAFDDKSEADYVSNVEHDDANSSELLSCKTEKKHKKKKDKYLENTNEIDNLEKNAGQKLELVENNSDSSGERKRSKKKKKKRSKEMTDEENNLNDNDVVSEVTTLENSIPINDGEHQDSDDISMSQKCKKKKSKKHKRKSPETTPQDQVMNIESTEPSSPQKVKYENNFDSCLGESKVKDETQLNESKQDRQESKSGQWSSAELGDSERQSKFMRLLGGFKKGNNSSQIQKKFGFGLQSKGDLPNRPGGNFAMNKQQQDIYNKNLESDYERAMGMNLNRGIGLGFQKPPDEGKKLYIDTKSSKSVKFDD